MAYFQHIFKVIFWTRWLLRLWWDERLWEDGQTVAFFFILAFVCPRSVPLRSAWHPSGSQEEAQTQHLDAWHALSDSVYLLFSHIGLLHSLNSSPTKLNVSCFALGRWGVLRRTQKKWLGTDSSIRRKGQDQLEFWRHWAPEGPGPCFTDKGTNIAARRRMWKKMFPWK